MFDDPKDKFMGTSTDDDLDSSGDTTKVGLAREIVTCSFSNRSFSLVELSFRC